MGRTRARRAPFPPSSHAGLLALVVAVCLALVGVEGHRLWGARQAKLEEARRETANLARSLAQHAQDAVEAADAALLGLRERAELDGTGTAAQVERLHRSMAVQGAALPLVHGLFLFDRHGASLATSASAGPTGLNYADRAYFQHHRSSPDRGPHVSGPFRSKTDNSWIVVLSRRVDRTDGGYAGVVLATLSIDFFQRFYGTFDVGALGVITLASKDGAILARRPYHEHHVGRSLAESELYRKHIHRGAAGSYEAVGGVDGLFRLGSFHHAPRYPLVVVVSRVKREVLAGWRAQAWTEAAVVLAVTLAIGLLGWRARSGSGSARTRATGCWPTTPATPSSARASTAGSATRRPRSRP